jgi:hypothetical protein
LQVLQAGNGEARRNKENAKEVFKIALWLFFLSIKFVLLDNWYKKAYLKRIMRIFIEYMK